MARSSRPRTPARVSGTAPRPGALGLADAAARQTAALLTVLLIGMLVVVLSGLVTAAAQSAPAAPAAAGSHAAAGTTTAAGGAERGTRAPVMIVIDGSGSMKAADVDAEGTTRMDAAKAAARTVVDSVSPDAQLGLMEYGTKTGGSDAEKAAGCKDITLLSPVGPVDRDALTEQIDGIRASGYTPIGAALEQAAAELPDEGQGGIVLLSDGVDTCAPPPPCEVAQELAEQGLDLQVHTIGLRVDEEARDELQCIAEATHGTYADASDVTSIEGAMEDATKAAISGYDATGTPVTGGESPEDAVDVQPGQHLDTLPRGSGKAGEVGSARWYRIQVEAGQRAFVSGTMIPRRSAQSASDYDGLTVRMEVAGESSCSVFANSVESSRNSGDLPPSVVADSGIIGPDNAQASCLDEATELLVRVERIGGAEEMIDTAYPLELGVVIQPAIDGAAFPDPPADPVQHDFLPAAAGGVGSEGTAQGGATAFPGGSSFATAPELTEGTVQAPILSGEVQYYRIPVAYGQQVRLRADVTVPVLAEDSFDTALPQMWLLNPNRGEVESVRPGEPGAADFDGEFIGGDRGRVFTTANVDAALALNSAFPVNPRNGAGSGPGTGIDGAGSAAVAGFYYVAVGLAVESDDLEGAEGAFTLSWDVVGDPIDAEGAAGAGDTEGGDTQGGDTGSGPGSGTGAQDGASGFAISPTIIAVIGAVAAVLAGLAVGAFLLIRRRQRTPTGTGTGTGTG